ncbi:MAG: glycosyltransferase family 4 protein [Firmicutes bacterium]|nr:glycosyltransferase family 4 protein [Bacillota bacterium]
MAKKTILITTIGKYPHLGGKSVHINSLEQLMSKYSDGEFEPTVLSFSDLRTFSQMICSSPRVFSNIPLDFALRRAFLLNKLKKIDLTDMPVMLIQDSPAFLLAKKVSKPFILTIHGSSADEYASKKDIVFGDSNYRKLLQEEIDAAKKASFVITVDTNLKNQIIARSHIDSSRVISLPNTVDPQVFYPAKNKAEFKKAHGYSSKDFVTVLTRRLVPKNGVHIAILALALLDRPNVKLVIAGDGKERESLNELVLKLNLEGQVRFLGALEHQKTPDLLKCADLCLLPSIPDQNVIEATSISALEAMASSAPIIASNIGGLKELLDKEAGLLVKPNDAEALKAAWQTIIDNPELGDSLGKRARKKVLEEYSMEIWIKTYLNLIRQTIKEGTRRPEVRR